MPNASFLSFQSLTIFRPVLQENKFQNYKNDHITTSYRRLKKFDNTLLLNNPQNDLNLVFANF